MAAPTIPGASTQAVNTVGSTQNFTVQWWNFFNSLLGFVTTGPLGPIPLVGVTDGSSAAAGIVGEYLSAFRPNGSSLLLTSTVDTQIASLALTAGDWDLTGEVFAQPTAATLTDVKAAINTTVSTAPAAPADGLDQGTIRGISTASLIVIPGMRTRVSIVSPTTYLLVMMATFTGTSVGGYGALRARRMR